MRQQTATILLCLAPLPLPLSIAAQTRQQHLSPLSAAERTSIRQRWTTVATPPGVNHMRPDTEQSFNLVEADRTILTVVPVLYTATNATAGPLFTCGAYILPAGGPGYFLDGRSGDDLPVQCWKIISIRLVRNATAQPDIVFTANVSLTSHSWQQEYVLSQRKNQPYQLSVDLKDAP